MPPHPSPKAPSGQAAARPAQASLHSVLPGEGPCFLSPRPPPHPIPDNDPSVCSDARISSRSRPVCEPRAGLRSASRANSARGGEKTSLLPSPACHRPGGTGTFGLGPATVELEAQPSPAPRRPRSLDTRTARRPLPPPPPQLRKTGRRDSEPPGDVPTSVGQPRAAGAAAAVPAPAAPPGPARPAGPRLPPLRAVRPRPPAAPRWYSPAHPSSNGSVPPPFFPLPRMVHPVASLLPTPFSPPPYARAVVQSRGRSRWRRHRRDPEVFREHFRGEGLPAVQPVRPARPGYVSVGAFSSRECSATGTGRDGTAGEGQGGYWGLLGPRGAAAAPLGYGPELRGAAVSPAAADWQLRRETAPRECLILFL